METPVELAFVHDVGKVPVYNTASAAAPLSGGDSLWRPDPCIRDVTMHGTSGNKGLKMPAAGTWTTYLDLVPFPEFREDVSGYLAKNGMKRGMRSSNISSYTVMYFDKCSTAASLSFKNATSLFFYTLVPNLPLPDPGDTECAFNEFYAMMCLVLALSPNVKQACMSPATRTHSLFGVDLRPNMLAGFLEKCPTTMTQVAQGFRQSAETRTWLMRQLFSDFDKIVDTAAPKVAHSKTVAVRMAAGTDAGEWRAFVRDLCAPTALKDENVNVNVHLARIVEVVTTEQVPNPAYAAWRQENDECNNESRESGGNGGNGGTGGSDGGKKGRRDPPPAPTLTERRVSREVCVERVNDIRKPMDTVYLRHDDRVSLMRSLELFRDRRELMSQLGLPHKLGVLLHGLVSTTFAKSRCYFGGIPKVAAKLLSLPKTFACTCSPGRASPRRSPPSRPSCARTCTMSASALSKRTRSCGRSLTT
jgi:hypothetical protein